MSKYYDDEQLLKSKRCEECYGEGEVDDAEPGDISFNTYICPSCKGTGYREKE